MFKIIERLVLTVPNSCVWSIKTFACVFNFGVYEYMDYYTLICNAVDVLFLPTSSISLAYFCTFCICMAAVEESGANSYNIYRIYTE